MELSDSVVEGVQAAGSPAFDASSFQQLLQSSLHCVLEPEKCTAKEDSNAVYKEALFGLCTLLLELARLDVDSASISAFLEECKFSPERAKLFSTEYLVKKDALRATLERVSGGPPHVVDVQWRLDYYLKNNHMERVSKPEYLIHFITEHSENLRRVQFACTQEQLQDLVLKLKDATKTLDKYIQQ